MKIEIKNTLTLPTVLFLIFLVLKLTKLIKWSWLWVTSPIWISCIIFLVVLAIVGMFSLILFKNKKK